MISTKKISQTLIEYAEPLIQELHKGYSQRDLESTLKLATVVWNASVMDQWHNTAKNITAELLIARKAQLFAGDIRAITNETVAIKNGEFVIRAEARLGMDRKSMN
jgi:hypothetical protein